MAKAELKGRIITVGHVTQVGANKMFKQTVMFEVPPYTDEFGDAKGKAELWELAVLGEQVQKLGLSDNNNGQKAKVKIYLNSNTVEKADKSGTMQIINAVIGGIDLIPL